MTEAKPYKISVPQAKIDRLKAKLELVDFPTELEEAQWDYGSPLADIKRLHSFWLNSYDWRKAEAQLNKMTHYTMGIPVEGYDSLNIHFVHHKSEVKGAIPLLFVHGWPGSFDEVKKLLEPLTKPDEGQPAFHVVAPSLPGFGFSEAAKKKGFRTKQMAEIFNKLMQNLGYDQYVTQAGDIGMSVTRLIAYQYPKNCRASHHNMPVPNAPSLSEHKELYFKTQQTPLKDFEKKGLERTKWFTTEGQGYSGEHSTKPQTLGYSLADSPIGLLAWVYEKLHDWTDDYPWTDEEIITWISIYVFSTAGAAASIRNYYEAKHDTEGLSAKCASYIKDVKFGCARFPKELFQPPVEWNHTLGEVVLNSVYDKGGHFAAWERPDAIVKDLREMFGKNGAAYAVVQGRTGF